MLTRTQGQLWRVSRGFVAWLTGLPEAGKTTTALELLRSMDGRAELLDGDEVRRHLGPGLGYSREDRRTQVIRLGWIASLLARNDVGVIVAAVSPHAAARTEARDLIEHSAPFFEVHVATSLAECIRRDSKGLYARAAAGAISCFTGVSDPYEEPLMPDVRLDTASQTPWECAELVLEHLRRAGVVRRASLPT